MAHTRNKRDFRKCMELLGGPQHLHYATRVNGRRVLDTPHSGQQELQALLFSCLNSPRREHAWDLMPGRCFNELLLYFDLLSPQEDRLIIRAGASARLASYLLPYTRVFPDGAFEHSGVPGFRVDGCSRRSVMLVHIPTGGYLQLQDCLPHSADIIRDDLDTQLRHRTAVEQGSRREPAWTSSDLTPHEESVLTSRYRGPDALLLSALMARNYLFWRHDDHEVALRTARRSTCVGRLAWVRGESTDEIGELLTGHAVGIPGAVYEPAEKEFGLALLRVGNSQLELDGPFKTRRRLRARSRSDSHTERASA